MPKRFCHLLAVLALGLPLSADLLQDLSDASPERRTEAILALSPDSPEISPEVMARLVDAMDDRSQVVLRDDRGVEFTSSPGKASRDLLQGLGTRALSPLLVGLVNHRPSIRWRCADLLGQIQSAEALDALVAAVENDRDRLVQIKAGDALVAQGVAALPYVMELLEHPSTRVRKQAIYVLGKSGDERVVAPLLQVATLSDSDDALQAREALLATGNLLVAPILELISGDAPIPQKMRAISMAGQLRSRSAAETLIYILLTSMEEPLRMGAFVALRNYLSEDFLVHPLFNAATDINPNIAAAAPSLLALLPPNALAQGMQYIRGTSETMQGMAFELFRRVGSKAHPLFLDIMKDETLAPQVRIQAARVLREGNFIGVALEDRIEAVVMMKDWQALGAMSANIEPRLQALASHEDHEYREAALRHFAMSGKPSHYPFLVKALGDSHPTLRERAREALVYAGPKAHELLRAELAKDLGHRSRNAALVLQRTGYRPRTEIEHVQISVSLQDWRAVARQGDAAVTYLSEMLSHSDPGVALWAAKAFADFNHVESLARFNVLAVEPALYEVLRLGGNRDNSATLKTLSTLHDGRSIALLFAGWFSRDAETQESAREALLRVATFLREHLRVGLQAADLRTRQRFLELVRQVGRSELDLLLPYLEDREIGAPVITALGEDNYVPATLEETIRYLFVAQSYDQLAQMGQAGRNRLLVGIRDRHPNRVAMARALLSNSNHELLPWVLRWMDDSNPDLARMAAAKAGEWVHSARNLFVEYAQRGNITLSKNAARLLRASGVSAESEAEAIWLLAASQDFRATSELGERFNSQMRQHLLSGDLNRRAIAAASLAASREFVINQELRQRQEFFMETQFSLTNAVPEVRAIAAFTIGARMTNAVHTIPLLSQMLGDDQELGQTYVTVAEFRDRRTPGIQAAFALARLGPPALEALRAAAANEAAPIARDNARFAMALMVDSNVVPEQLRYLESSDHALASYAAGALAAAGRSEALPLLVERAIDPGIPYRTQAKRAVASFGEAATPSVVAALRRSYSERQLPEILDLISLLQSPELLPFLKRFLEHEDLAIRRRALLILGSIGSDEATRTLLTATRDPLWLVRETAAAQIQRIGRPAIPVLLDAMETPEMAGPGFALRLLQQVSGLSLGEDPGKWRHWWQESTNGAAPLVPES